MAKMENNGSVLRRSKNHSDKKLESYELKIPASGKGSDKVGRDFKDEQRLLSTQIMQDEGHSTCGYPMYLKIEKCCTVLLPLSYVVFNLWYWVYHMYMIESNE